jgi:hypothetical protein
MPQTDLEAVSGVVHPVAPPPIATHFKLTKGGITGAPCFAIDHNGVQVDRHPLELFDKNEIEQRWGFDPAYYVQFFSEGEAGRFKPQGGKRRFGLLGDVAEPKSSAMVMSSMGQTRARDIDASDGMQNALAMLMSIKQIAASDANAQIENNRINAEAALSATREAHASNMNIMAMVLSNAFKANERAATPAMDPTMAMLLQNMQAQQAATQALLARFLGDEEGGEDEEDDSSVKYTKLLKDAKKNGIGAILSFAKDEGISALIEALPLIKEKLPQLMAMLAPMLEAKLSEVMQPKTIQAPSMPPPRPYTPPPVAFQAPPPRAAKPRRRVVETSPAPAVTMVDDASPLTPAPNGNRNGASYLPPPIPSTDELMARVE